MLESNPNLKAVDGKEMFGIPVTDGSFARGFDKKRKGAKGKKMILGPTAESNVKRYGEAIN